MLGIEIKLFNRKESRNSYQQVIGNPLISDKILENVKEPQTILKFRLVSTTWLDLCTDYLVRKRHLPVTISLDRGCFSYPFDTPPDYPHLKLAQLNQLLENSKHIFSKFPSNSFVFDGGHLEHLEVQKFFKNYGKIVRRLKFRSFWLVQGFDRTFNLDTTLLGHLLHYQVPNLHTLYINLGQLLKFVTQVNDGCLKLPNLRRLGLHKRDVLRYHPLAVDRCYSEDLQSLFQKLIREVAVNLEYIHCVNWSLDTTMLCWFLQDLGRLDLIYNIKIRYDESDDEGFSGRLETLSSSSQWRLKQLSTTSLLRGLFVLDSDKFYKISGALEKIMETSRHSLETVSITVVSLENLFHKIDFPSGGFPKVTTLKLYLFEVDRVQMCCDFVESGGQLPFNPPLNVAFPNVRKILVNNKVWWIRQENQGLRNNPILMSRDSCSDLQNRISGSNFDPSLIRITDKQHDVENVVEQSLKIRRQERTFARRRRSLLIYLGILIFFAALASVILIYLLVTHVLHP